MNAVNVTKPSRRCLAFIAIAAAPILQSFAERIATYLEISARWGSAPAVAVPVFGIFVGLYMLFDRYLWKLGWVRKLLLIPDLNGAWECNGHTVLKNGEEVDIHWNGVISVTQSWSKILIHLRTSQSESKSISGSLYHDNGVGFRLLYQYDNRPNADETDLLNHSGSVELLFNESATEASGSYFTDRHRTTVGTMSLTKEVKNVEA